MDLMKHCLWNDLIPAVPLEKLIMNQSKFRLMKYDPTNFNVYHIIEKEKRDDLFRLSEEIFDVVKCSELILEEDPYVGEVVLAPHPEHDNEYYRGYIDKIHFDPVDSWKSDASSGQSSAAIYFFDVGGYYDVKFKKLKPVTNQIMRFPILGYRVTLCMKKRHDDTEDLMTFSGDGLLLSEKFIKPMNKFKNMDLTIHIEIGELLQNEVPDVFYSHPVTIQYEVNGKRIFLSDKLTELTIWEWEMISKEYRNKELNDATYIAISSWDKNSTAICGYALNADSEFTAQVTRVIRTNSPFVGKSEIRIILLDNPLYENYFAVLQNQMNRYAKLVAKSSYYPAIRDVFMFKLDAKEEYKQLGIKHLGEWCRAVKIDINWIYLMDWDDNIPLNGVDDDDYDMRPLYREFLQIPSLVVTVLLQEHGVPMDYSRATNLLTPGRRFRFRSGSVKTENVEFLKPADQNKQKPSTHRPELRAADDSSTSSTDLNDKGDEVNNE